MLFGNTRKILSYKYLLILLKTNKLKYLKNLLNNGKNKLKLVLKVV